MKRRENFARTVLIGISLCALLALNDLTKRRATESLVKEKVGKVLVHGFREMDSVPANEVLRILAHGGGQRGREEGQVESEVSLSGVAARLRRFLHVVLLCIGEDGEVCVPVIGVEDRGVGVLFAECLELVFEDEVVVHYSEVSAGDAAHVVGAAVGVRRHVCREAAHGREPLNDDVFGPLVQQCLCAKVKNRTRH